MSVYRDQQLPFGRAFQSGSGLRLKWGNTFPDWFQSIPPERVGVNGEYDYYGLKKRVEVQFKQCFSATDLSRLSVNQRGRVIILQGAVANEAVLRHLAELARSVDGCTSVETRWVRSDADLSLLVAV
ncbi:hypothetical protein PN498_07385 [Oscillatoria sp. CS-180]|uniref:hypothetical protein n=1 Tax=Oscillatoria sp. CS-180 TaxID=3021720 RepID=UPI00232D5693|nr:hypothetical protein [Oscillatoria sp. CS-180]MDB9525803.1 hypothetical protein [Oscillatoria sp. CS-180]